MERQVETIRNLVESYMKIVSKAHRDLVPKALMCIIIDEIKSFLKEDILSIMYSCDANTIMEESPEEKDRRENVMRSYQALKDALNIINDVSSKTVSVPVPSPVCHGIYIQPEADFIDNYTPIFQINDDWRQTESFDSNTRRPPPPPPNMVKPKPSASKALPPPLMPQR